MVLIAWEQLQGQLQENFDPPVPQLIADSYLHAAIKEAADTLPSPSRNPAVRQLSEIEENAINAAGYVVRVLMEKYKEAVGPVAADFMACLLNMLEGSSLDIEQNESFEECAARWVKLTNQGGLLILRQGAYWLFRDIELLLWPFLRTIKTQE